MMNGKFSMGEIEVAEPGTGGGRAESGEFAIYFTNGRDPAYSIICTEPYKPACSELFPEVPIPNGAYASSDRDHHASVIVQSSAQTYEYDFWEFNCYAKASRSMGKSKGKCTGTTDPVSGGGTVYVAYGSNCNANSFADGGTCYGSAVAAGVPTQPGLLDARELTAAQIRHVLFVSVGCPNGKHVWPADVSDGYPTSCHVKGGPAEGERVWLDLTNSQIDQLGDPKWAKPILHAMHNYGLFVVDTAGSFAEPWAFYALDSATFTYIGETDPWATFLDGIGCQARSNPCGYAKKTSHLPIPLTGIKQSDIHIVP